MNVYKTTADAKMSNQVVTQYIVCATLEEALRYSLAVIAELGDMYHVTSVQKVNAIKDVTVLMDGKVLSANQL